MDYTSFSKEDFDAFRANDRPGPIHMLKLAKLRDRAEYPDGRQATGAEAYAAYGKGSEAVFKRLGGRIMWRGRMEQMVIGPKEKDCDLCFISEYPSPQAFAEMLKDPVYREAMAHRQAGVADSRLIRMAPLPAAESFAG